MRKLSLNAKVLATIFGACLTCTVAAIVVARIELASMAREDLVEKSRAILSRLEVGRGYIANSACAGPKGTHPATSLTTFR